MARKYTKKSDYWKKFEDKAAAPPQPPQPSQPKVPNIQYDFSGNAIVDTASRSGSTRSGATNSRKNRSMNAVIPLKYGAIDEFMLPYSYDKEGISIREAIILCQKGYAGVPIVKNSVDLMAEFANGDIFLEGGNEASRRFFEAWFSVMRLDKLKAQYFLEYYRGSNVFFYKQMGKLSKNEVSKLAQYLGSKERGSAKIPVRYVLLNPVDIMSVNASTFSGKNRQFIKILSQYELESLKNPKNEIDKKVLESFNKEDREKIAGGGFQRDGMKIELNPNLLIYSFAKKQDYEPFAIPFIFPVLADVNTKLELKKLDLAIMRTIENAVLLITMGAKPDEGGINPENMKAVQELFQNEAAGRVLVSDYTTKGEWLIPDIAKVVGPEKYTVINEDIKEGLQNVVTGNDKYASTAIKAQLFLERLNESRSNFLNDILIPEMNIVAAAMGFRNVPTPVFKETTMKDEVQFTRAVTRLMELSLLTPEQGLTAINNGRLPDITEGKAKQQEFKKDRDAGLYEPIIGGGGAGKEEGRPTGDKKPQDNKRGSKASVSVSGIGAAVEKTERLFSYAHQTCKKRNLNENQSQLVIELCKTIVESSEMQDWSNHLDECLKDNKKIAQFKTLPQILDIASEYNCSTYEAALIYHGEKNK